MCRLILLVVLNAISVSSVFGQYFETQTFPARHCYNPNERPGTCVSIYDCQTLLSVVQRGRIQPLDKEFLRASKCGEYDSETYVCCTADTGFRRNAYDAYDRQPSTILRPANAIEYEQPQWQWKEQPFSKFDEGGRGFNSIRRAGSDGRGKQQRDIPADSQVSVRAAVTLPHAPTCGGVTISNKIYNGIDTDLYEFPWLTLLEYKRPSGTFSTSCAGSLISNRYVLTAAHCVKGKIVEEFGTLNSIWLGEYDITKDVDCFENSCAPAAMRVGIEETIPHELYRDDSYNKENDIALIRLTQDIRFSDSIRPICLPSVVNQEVSEPVGGTLYTVAGWGATRHSPKSAIKQKLQVPFVELQQCQRKFWERKVNVVDSQICAGGIFSEDSCFGDSGGPLMRFRNDAWVLEGIVSFGYRCGLQGWPAVHTRVAYYDDWIRSKLRK